MKIEIEKERGQYEKTIDKQEQEALIKSLERQGGARVGRIDPEHSVISYEFYWLKNTMIVFCSRKGIKDLDMFEYHSLSELRKDYSFGLRRSFLVKRLFTQLQNNKEYFKELSLNPLIGGFASRDSHASAMA